MRFFLFSLLFFFLSQINIGETNKHRYVVATQSQPLRMRLRSIPAVPLVHVNRAVMVLEPPSDITIKIKEAASPSIHGVPVMSKECSG